MGANSYFVVVAKDANFTNVVDEGFTRIPAYAPRNTLAPTTYPDETTIYYWAVLPASAADGSDALPLGIPTSAVGSFQKQSTPPARVFPANGTRLPRPAAVPVDAGAGRSQLPAPGLAGSELRQPDRRS